MTKHNLDKLEEIINEIEKFVFKFLGSVDAGYKTYEDYILLTRFCNSGVVAFKQEIIARKDLINNEYVFRLVESDLNSILGNIKTSITRSNETKTSKILSDLAVNVRKFHNVIKDLEVINVTASRLSEMIKPEVDKALEEVKAKVGKIDSAILAIEQHETDRIYLNLSGKYKWEYIRNNFYFFLTLSVVTYFSFAQSMSIAEIAALGQRELFIFITIKIFLITLTITLCTLFLRRASHAKKLQDQAYQTHVEISAFPIHVRSLKEEDKNELVKELAMKYFGKELDQTQNDKVGDLMKDQLNAGTELVKASVELVKVKDGSKTPQ